MKSRLQLIIRPTHREISDIEHDSPGDRWGRDENVFIVLPSASSLIRHKRDLLDLQLLTLPRYLEIRRYMLKSPIAQFATLSG